MFEGYVKFIFNFMKILVILREHTFKLEKPSGCISTIYDEKQYYAYYWKDKNTIRRCYKLQQ